MIILGCGPIGLLCALRGRQLGLHVELYESGTSQGRAAPRLECVPSQFVALLVEFGITPKRAGIDRLHGTRTMQWAAGSPVKLATPDAAHVERPALDIALRQSALQAGVLIGALNQPQLGELQQRHTENRCLLLDATGRAALTARRRGMPKRPPVARLFHLPMQPDTIDPDLMIAAGPHGYAYRLGHATTLTLGVVGRGDFVRGDSRQIVAGIASFAPWLVDDIPPEYLEPGASGPAGVQWSHGSSGNAIRVGDAAFARDALASQGLAIGVSDAFKLIAPNDRSAASRRLDERRAVAQHCRRIVDQIAGSPFGASPHWAEYAAFLANMADGSGPAVDLPLMQASLQRRDQTLPIE